MTTITTRSGKGSPLTNDEVDANFTNLNDDKIEASGDSMTGNLSFGDNNKVILGSGNDLQLYHDGSNSIIKDNGTGGLILEGTTSTQIKGSSFVILRSLDGENMAVGNANGSFDLYHNNVLKLATTSTGIDVTGTVTADGLTVDVGSASTTVALFSSDNSNSWLNIESGADSGVYLGSNSGTFRLLTDTTNRLAVGTNGDISFYEDTGTTAKLFWDASAESLGIGTTSPIAALDVTGTDSTGSLTSLGDTVTRAAAVIRGSTHANGYGLYMGYGNSTTDAQYIQATRASGSTAFPLLLNPYGGNVGIGTSSPSSILTAVSGASADETVLTVANDYSTADAAGDASGLMFQLYRSYASSLNDAAFIKAEKEQAWDASGDRDSALTFGTRSGGTEPTERMRISSDGSCRWTPDGTSQDMTLDASGNLLVGKTSASVGTDGAQLLTGGYSGVSATSTTAFFANRNSTDGDVVEIGKNGVKVGSIGYGGGGILFNAASQYGLKFYDAGGSNIIHPATTAGGDKDASVDLGYADSRFKDLYLSGGAYLGGVGSANLLDDYEEGTWTPVYEGSTTAGTGTYTRQSGVYVKVGDLVYASCTIGISAHTGSGNARVSGLPFSSFNSTANYAAISVGFNNGHATTSGYQIIGFVQIPTAAVHLYETGGTGQQNALAMDTSFTELDFTIVYRAS